MTGAGKTGGKTGGKAGGDNSGKSQKSHSAKAGLQVGFRTSLAFTCVGHKVSSSDGKARRKAFLAYPSHALGAKRVNARAFAS